MGKKGMIIVLIVLVGVCNSISAQKITIGAKGGLNISNFVNENSNNELNSGYTSRRDGYFGLYGEYHFTSLFSVSVGADYTSLGGVKNKIQPLPDYLTTNLPSGYTYYADVYNTIKLNCLTMPLLARLNVPLGKTSPFSVYAAAGPFIGLLLSAHQYFSGTSMLYSDASGDGTLDSYDEFYFENSQNIKSKYRTVNFGVEGLVGISLKVSSKVSLFLEGGKDFGLISIQKSSSDGNCRTKAVILNAGCSYSF